MACSVVIVFKLILILDNIDYFRGCRSGAQWSARATVPSGIILALVKHLTVGLFSLFANLKWHMIVLLSKGCHDYVM